MKYESLITYHLQDTCMANVQVFADRQTNVLTDKNYMPLIFSNQGAY
jgi:hypothetical protein